MAVSKSRSSQVSVLPKGMRTYLRNKMLELAGLGVLAAAAAVALALVTWSVKDPSFNHATGDAPNNLLGYPGAVVADLLMQLFGLGAIGLMAPVCVWGAKLLSHTVVSRMRRRLPVWFIAGFLVSGALAVYPTPSGWPLPTGLGGVTGDFMLSPFVWVFGGFLDNMMALIVAGVILGVLALTALAYSASITPSEFVLPLRLVREEGADLALRVLGGAIHTVLSLRSAVARRSANARSIVKRPPEAEFDDAEDDREADDDDGRTRRRELLDVGLDDDGEDEEEQSDEKRRNWGISDLTAVLSRQFAKAEEVEPDARIEPGFRTEPAFDESPAPHLEDGPAYAPANDEDDHMDDGHAGDPDVHDPQPSRVSAPAPQIKPGRRIRTEAQPSLPLARNGPYELPPLNLLATPKSKGGRKSLSNAVLEENARMLEGVLEDFGVRGEIINVRPGPIVTLYELEPAPGIKSSRVIGLADDIARSMSAISARVAVVPGRNVIGIELPNQDREMVFLRELLASQDYEESGFDLSLALGKTIGGEPVISDLARMPHLLIAGTTGSGKSVGINTMILSLLFRMPPDKCKLIMIDPKMLELSVYDGIPHLLAPVVTDPKKAVVALKWTVKEMEDRYRKMSKVGVRNIDGFNDRVAQANAKGEVIVRTVQTGFDKETGQPVYEQEEMDLEPMPYIVVIVDEMADLMMVAGKDIEGTVQRLAQMARAAGIHMITATQRPSVDVITGTIKANFPTRISFMVTSKIDSRTILGEQGAEQLLGQGDMLYMAGGGRISRVHGAFVSDQEVEKIVKHLKKQGIPEYLEAVTEEPEDGGYELPGMGGDDSSESDDLYDRAVAIVGRDKKASTSYIQRRLSIGYNRAATIIERMEAEGVVGPANHAGKREILIGEPGEGVNA